MRSGDRGRVIVSWGVVERIGFYWDVKLKDRGGLNEKEIRKEIEQQVQEEGLIVRYVWKRRW